MLCQNCGERDAVIHVYANVNGRREAVNLCQTCYSQLSQGKQTNNLNNNNSNDNNPFGSYCFDDLILQMLQQAFTTNSQNISQASEGGNNDDFILGNYMTNMNDQDRSGLIDSINGHDDKIIRVIELLKHRTKNKPFLIGETG